MRKIIGKAVNPEGAVFAAEAKWTSELIIFCFNLLYESLRDHKHKSVNLT